MKQLPKVGPPWQVDLADGWLVAPLRVLGHEVKARNDGMVENNLLSLSYGNLKKRDIESSDGLVPASYESYNIIEQGDVVFRFTDLQNDKKSLRSALADEDGIITSAYMTFRPQNIHPKYFAYLMRGYDLTKVFYSYGGGVRQTLSFEDVKNLPCLVPPWASQMAIVDFLDHDLTQMDATIAAQEELVEKLIDRRLSAVKHYVFRGISGEETYPAVRCRYLCTIQTGSGDTVDAIEGGRYPFYVRSETPLSHDKFEFTGPAVLTAGDGAGVGKIYHYVDGQFMAHQRVYVLSRFNHVSPRFFFYAFSAFFGERALDGSAKSTVDSVRRSMLTDLQIPVPPAQDQADIVDLLDETIGHMDRMIEAARDSIELLRERRSAVIAAAVTGRLDSNTGTEFSSTELELA